MKSILIACSVVVLTLSCSQPKKSLSYADVADRLTDMKALAIVPEEGERTAMWSSYDRRSRYDETTGKYIEWYANGDGANQQIRLEGEDAVLAEMEGPGAIVRIWSAMPDTGHVKIYIDGSDEPVVDLPFAQFFDRTVSPFDYEGLVYMAARGCNNYVPITYNRSCRVVASPGWGVYYHFNYITFPEGSSVEPFSMALSADALTVLEEANALFTGGSGASPYDASAEDTVIAGAVEVLPGESEELAGIEGTYAIREFRVVPSFSGREDAMTGLRKLVLTMTWDGEEKPAVWAPLGDYFGTTPAINEYRTLPLGMTEGHFYSFWYMPFSDGAEIRVENQGDKAYSFEYEIIMEPLGDKADEYTRFHAWWHSDVLPVEVDRWPDWTLLETKGKGRYVGTMLHVMNPSDAGCREPAGEGHAWWGEGDEKFFVDGEKFPSTFGTGTEDYFGYAWGNPEYFEKAFHSQSITTGNKAHQTVTRWHIIDQVPFRESFKGYIEKYYPNECGTRYNSVSYWYLAPGGENPMPVSDITVDLVLMPPQFDAEQYFGLPGEKVVVKLSGEGDEIRYTTDGSEPTRESELYTGRIVVSGSCTIRAKSFLGERESQPAQKTVRILEWLKPVSPAEDLVTGLTYRYYEKDEKWLELPDFSEMTPVKTGEAERVELGMQERDEHWGVVFEGYIRIEKNGIFDFFLNSDDGSRLHILDQMIVDNDKNHAETEVGGKAALYRGYYPFRVEFFENELSQVLEFRYAGPGFEKQEVPAEVLLTAVDD